MNRDPVPGDVVIVYLECEEIEARGVLKETKFINGIVCWHVVELEVEVNTPTRTYMSADELIVSPYEIIKICPKTTRLPTLLEE